MSESSIPGYPRIGRNRELKKAIESYWSGKLDADGLEREAMELRREHWTSQERSGVRRIPVGDFSYYDPMLDLALLFGYIPARFERLASSGSAGRLDLYFAMARGAQDIPAMEMTKWFDTNYHYIVPEISGDPAPELETPRGLLAQFREARAILGSKAKPVLIGPYTFLRLARITDGRSLEHHLEKLAPAYGQVLSRLSSEGAEWIQIDEPALVFSGPLPGEAALVRAYEEMAGMLRASSPGAKLLLQTYFGPIWERRALLERLPVDGIGIDLVRGSENWRFLEETGTLRRSASPDSVPLSDRTWVAGVLDGRNVWRADLEGLARRLSRRSEEFGPRLWIGTSCSLQYLPYSTAADPGLDPEVRTWLAFAEDRLEELETLRRALSEGIAIHEAELERISSVLLQKANSARTTNPEVRRRLERVRDEDFKRAEPFADRYSRQREAFALPPLPTTTIGSFPQTPEVRQARSRLKSGKLDPEAYGEFIREGIEKVIRLQEEIGLDVLVHGEFERSDMVDYFGERLEGMCVTENGWVQSYGTRCVRPPIIFGDVSRRGAMTVRESRLAQLLTRKPVKGMLTGPVTILNWSFPREDLPRAQVAFQLALALRDETLDLEEAGIRMIQIDEPAFREGLPLRSEAREEYLNWAVRAFRLASSGVRAETQIHTHMCYSEFNEIISWIAAMDADVISIENSRSSGELLQAFREFRYSNGIGPGVYDIHSPRVPSVDEMQALIRRSLEVLPPELLWVNPDCGLKTRKYEEAVPSLKAMVDAARRIREQL